MPQTGQWLVSAIVVVIYLSGCLSTVEDTTVAVHTDKQQYTFGEKMIMQITVNASSPSTNNTVKIVGLQNRQEVPQLERTMMQVDLSRGTNILNVSANVPNCSPCTKLDPGLHTITVTLFNDNKQLSNSTCTVELIQ